MSARIRVRILNLLSDGVRRRTLEIWQELRDVAGSQQTIINAMRQLADEGVVQRKRIRRRLPYFMYWRDAA